MVLEEDVKRMDSRSFKRLEKEVYTNPKKDLDVVRWVVERSLGEQCESYIDNLFYSNLIRCKLSEENVLSHFFFKNRIEPTPRVNGFELLAFVQGFVPEKRFYFFNVMGKRFFRKKKVEGYANRVLKEVGSMKRLVLWPFNIYKRETNLVYGDCEETSFMGYKTFIFSDEDVFSYDLPAKVLGFTYKKEIVARTRTRKKELASLVFDAFLDGVNEVRKAVSQSFLSFYSINKAEDLTKEKERLILDEGLENVLLHEVGHNVFFATTQRFKRSIYDDELVRHYVFEVCADFAPRYREGCGPIKRMCEVAKEDNLRAYRMVGQHFYNNLQNFSLGDPSNVYHVRAVVNLAHLLLCKDKSGVIDFDKLAGHREKVYSGMKENPLKVLEESEAALKNFENGFS